jgi:hypothetical protein
MGAVTETFGERIAADVVTEAFDEMIGRSNRKWAVMLAAAIVGAIIAVAVTRRRRRPGEVVVASGH